MGLVRPAARSQLGQDPGACLGDRLPVPGKLREAQEARQLALPGHVRFALTSRRLVRPVLVLAARLSAITLTTLIEI